MAIEVEVPKGNRKLKENSYRILWYGTEIMLRNSLGHYQR
jgi:hypothetical protein